MSTPIHRGLLAFAERLRFPHLFWLVAALFIVDVAIPDPMPFLDEIVFGLATLLLGSWRRRRTTGDLGSKQP